MGTEQLFSEVPLSAITTDPAIQARAAMDPATVDDYAGAMADGAAFPPVILFRDGAAYWLADGFHRVEAAKRAGKDAIAADVRTGGRRDAVLYAAGANTTHGLRRTNADKRLSVLRLLNDPEWAQWGDREIARQCGVTHPFVGKLRSEQGGNDYHLDSRQEALSDLEAARQFCEWCDSVHAEGQAAVAPLVKRLNAGDDLTLAECEQIIDAGMAWRNRFAELVVRSQRAAGLILRDLAARGYTPAALVAMGVLTEAEIVNY